MKSNTAAFEKEKQEALKKAQYHKYGRLCVNDIKHAKTSVEISDSLELGRERRETAETAMDLCYPSSVSDAIWNAKSSSQLTNIMIDARNGKYH